MQYKYIFLKTLSRLKIEFKNEILCIDLDPLLTNGSALESRFNDYRLWIYPRANPNYWGSPQIWHMLVYTGMYHCRFVVKSRKKCRYSLVYAYFMAISKARKPSVMAEFIGRKVANVLYTSPMGRSLPPMQVNRYNRNQAPS